MRSLPSLRSLFRSPRFRVGVVLVGAWLVVAEPMLTGSMVPFDRDVAGTFLPLRTYFAERLKHGELAQWVPWNGLGVPYLGQVVTATFHPQSLLFLIFAPLTALTMTLLLAVLIAEIGAYRFARELGARRAGATVAGIAFGLSGYSLSMLNNPPYAVGLATLPWVGWAAARLMRRPDAGTASVLAVAWALVFLGGDAQSFGLVALLVGVLWLTSKRSPRALGWTVAAAIGATLLTAIELVPALEIARVSAREAWVSSPALSTDWALHPIELFGLAWPLRVPTALHQALMRAVTMRRPPGLWANDLYLGTLVVVAALAGALRHRRARWLFALAVFAMLLSMGGVLGLLPLFWKVLPLLARFRYPEKYLALTLVALVPGVGLGTDLLMSDRRRGPMMLAIAGAASGLVAVLLWTRVWHLSVDGLGRAMAPMVAIEAAVLLVAAAATWKGLALLVPALAIVDLVHANAGLIPLVPREAFSQKNPVADIVRAADLPTGGARLMITGLPDLLPPGTPGVREDNLRADLTRMKPSIGVLFHVDSFGVSLPGTSERYARVFQLEDRRSRLATLMYGPLFAGCYDLQDDDRPATRLALVDIPRYKLRLVSMPCAARARFVRTHPMPDLAHALDYLSVATTTDAPWEGGPALPLAQGTILWLKQMPEEIMLQVAADRDGALFLADLYAPGWTAWIDSRPARIYPTYVAGRGIEIPKGNHIVVFRYHTPGLMLGAALTILALIIAFAGWLSTLLPRIRSGRRSIAG